MLPRWNQIFRVSLLAAAFFILPNAVHAASSVYIPGVPSASSSAIGITCNAGGLGAGTLYCQNQSPGPVLTCAAGVCTSSSGFQNRLMFVTPGAYAWTIPSGVTRVKAVVMGPGGGGSSACGYGGGGGGYAEKTITVSGGQSVSVTVGAGGIGGSSGICASSAAGGTTTLTIGSTTISATGGQSQSGSGAGGVGSGGSINTNGGAGAVGGGGGGAGGPYANGGKNYYAGGGFGNGLTTPSVNIYNGQYGGYAFGITPGVSVAVNPLGINNSIWWDTRDIQGNGGIYAAILTSATYLYLFGTDGNLGGGGSAVYDPGAGTAVGGNGGFGGGGGSAGTYGGNGGIGGGGAQGSSGGNGGNGVAIIYW